MIICYIDLICASFHTIQCLQFKVLWCYTVLYSFRPIPQNFVW